MNDTGSEKFKLFWVICGVVITIISLVVENSEIVFGFKTAITSIIILVLTMVFAFILRGKIANIVCTLLTIIAVVVLIVSLHDTSQIDVSDEQKTTTQASQNINTGNVLLSGLIMFDANGGNVNETSRIITMGTPVTNLPIPSKTGFDFTGWFTENNIQITENTVLPSAKNTYLIAKWSAKSFCISWENEAGYSVLVERISSPNSDAGTGSIRNGDAVYYGDELSVTYVKSDYYRIVSSGSKMITVRADITPKDIFAITELNSISGWVVASEVPFGAEIVDRKWEYTKISYIESTESDMDGWNLIDSRYTWSAWGPMSEWSNSYVSSNEYVEVETRWVEPTFRTEYNYSRYNEYNIATHGKRGWNGPTQGYWNDHYCQYYEERGWSDDKLAYTFSDSGYNCYGGNWYNEETRQVEVTKGYEQYRYCTRSKIWTYCYSKKETLESESYPSENDVFNVQELVRYRPL